MSRTYGGDIKMLYTSLVTGSITYVSTLQKLLNTYKGGLIPYTVIIIYQYRY